MTAEHTPESVANQFLWVASGWNLDHFTDEGRRQLLDLAKPYADAMNANAEMLEALVHAETVFLRYAEIHDAKGTPDGRAKADANLKEAYLIHALIARSKGDTP